MALMTLDPTKGAMVRYGTGGVALMATRSSPILIRPAPASVTAS